MKDQKDSCIMYCMRRDGLIGRYEEWERLEECMAADSSQLVIVYGRRRVGKTFLINEFFDNDFAFKLTGAYDAKREDQLKNFASALSRKSKKTKDAPEDWAQAFNLLRDYLETLQRDKKQVIFFDELPWLDNHKSGFLSAFEWFWNDWASTQKHLICIVCGSATSWMDEKIENNKGGLFNRQTCKLYLKPFCLQEVKEYLEYKNIDWSLYDITECYMIMGGIPYYLSLLSNKLSLSQNVDRLFFASGGELWDEFNHLYRTLFTSSEKYIRVTEALSKKRSGLTRSDIIKTTGLQTNGDLTKILNDLELSGFIRVNSFYKKKKKDAVYQLCDYYSAFYFRFIKDHYGKDDNYWSKSTDNPSRTAWEGLSFEQVCMDHISQIKNKLGIANVLTEQYSWFKKGDGESVGAQIDLLFDRRDHTITICEMKFSRGEFEINKDYDLKLRNKIEVFRSETQSKETLQLAMVTTYGVKNNKYVSIIQNQVMLQDLFI